MHISSVKKLYAHQKGGELVRTVAISFRQISILDSEQRIGRVRSSRCLTGNIPKIKLPVIFRKII
jgi:hypothetical protein